ncbi:uncharacterized protein BP5553_08615 [Venustampulla echinocandica]|uniref:FAS1 domain-containing protein n=1 Tax=Venustampulla echinocandica TaxID=2656787 RepID=A0A370TEQ9_9HELO|nr:uncharacterized protein BP5553_08615 [Venustampulla echinocandica]RDL33176.1 hypothetical protein BP5553_08615 [Venustampulla echinocandica]
MRYTSLTTLFLAARFITTVYSQNQHPMADHNLGPAMPPQTEPPAPSNPADDDAVILSDVLGNDRNINIFAGFTRDFAPISQRFEDSSLNTTILAPVNSAIMGLPRKPWEDPKDYDRLGVSAYEGKSGEDRAHRNLRRFVEAHVVPDSPWEEGVKVDTLAGGKIWWESRDGKKIIQPGNIEVSSVPHKVYNGEVWVLKGAVALGTTNGLLAWDSTAIRDPRISRHDLYDYNEYRRVEMATRRNSESDTFSSKNGKIQINDAPSLGDLEGTFKVIVGNMVAPLFDLHMGSGHLFSRFKPIRIRFTLDSTGTKYYKWDM